METTKICKEQDCSANVRQAYHFLCEKHYEGSKAHSITKCRQCDAYKPSKHTLCRECYEKDMQKYRRYDPVSAETFSERTALVKGDQKAIDKRQLFHDQQAKCVYCGHKYGYSELQVEHIVPKVQGGQDNIRNCQLACYSCNKVKGEMTDQEFRRKHVSYLPQKERTPAAPPSTRNCSARR